MPKQTKPYATPAAIILCGGRSSRMGQSKALLDWHGQPLIARMVEKVSEVAHPVLVVASKDQALPKLARAIAVFDELPFPGPVSAFLTGLGALSEASEICLLLSCDLPLFEPKLIDLFASAIEQTDFAMPRIAGIAQPLCALYRVEAVRKVRKNLNLPPEGASMGQLRHQLEGTFLDEHACARADPTLGSFQQCNTPEEFARLITVTNS